MLVSVREKLREIAQKQGLIKDYVVETGTSGIWTYRKWSSGTAECWGEKTAAVSSKSVLNVPSFSFPFTFTAIPNINVGCTASGADLYRVHNLKDFADTQTMRLTFINNYTAQVNITASIYVIGKWK